MKRNYEKPNMDLEMFEANEYIAACFTLDCNGSGYVYVKSTWFDRYYYHHENTPCPESYEVQLKGVEQLTSNAYIKEYDGDVIDGFSWDYHFTTDLTSSNKTNHS